MCENNQNNFEKSDQERVLAYLLSICVLKLVIKTGYIGRKIDQYENGVQE